MFDLLFNEEDSGLESSTKKRNKAEDDNENNVEPKRQKLEDCKAIHSSLSYNRITAPPLTEYTSVDYYCEKKRGESFLPDLDSLSSSGLQNVQIVSSPIVFKTPKPTQERPIHLSNENKPYAFFSVEELSLVKTVKNWSNLKVTAVGELAHHWETEDCYLNSVAEKGSWQIRINTSLLKPEPVPQKLLQVYGELEVVDNIPVIRVNFFRYLGKIDLISFKESYKLMQKHIPDYINMPRRETTETPDSHQSSGAILEDAEVCLLNDTLDNCTFPDVE